MTHSDSSSTPHLNPASSPSPGRSDHAPQRQYEGSDPDLPARPESGAHGPNVSTVQVGASAAAAVTSALAASFFGVAGTLIGAAVGSIVSTVAGAMYANYLRRAAERLRGPRSVAIQRIPSDALASTPRGRLTGPADLPGTRSMRPIGDPRVEETLTVPLAGRTELIHSVDETALMATTSTVYGSGRRRSGPGDARSGPGSSRNGAVGASGSRNGRSGFRSRTPMLVLGGIAMAGFLISMGVVAAAEGVLGHPVSGGTSGSTLGRIVHTSKDQSTKIKVTSPATPKSSAKSSAKASTAPSAEPTVTESADVAPSPTPTTEPTATGRPSPTPTAAAGSEVSPGADAQATTAG